MSIRKVLPFSLRYCTCIHIRYRQIEGFLRALSRYIPKIRVPSFSQIRRRAIKIEIPLPKTLKEGMESMLLQLNGRIW